MASEVGLIATPGIVDLDHAGRADQDSITGTSGNKVVSAAALPGCADHRGSGPFHRNPFGSRRDRAGRGPHRVRPGADLDRVRARGSRSGPRSMGSASSPPVTHTTCPSCPSTWSSSGRGSPGSRWCTSSPASARGVAWWSRRQQVLPHRDPEVAAVLEENFLERGPAAHRHQRGGRAQDDGGVAGGDRRRTAGRGAPTCCWQSGRSPTARIGLEGIGVKADGGYIVVDEFQRTSAPHIYAAGDVTGQMPLSRWRRCRAARSPAMPSATR